MTLSKYVCILYARPRICVLDPSYANSILRNSVFFLMLKLPLLEDRLRKLLYGMSHYVMAHGRKEDNCTLGLHWSYFTYMTAVQYVRVSNNLSLSRYAELMFMRQDTRIPTYQATSHNIHRVFMFNDTIYVNIHLAGYIHTQYSCWTIYVNIHLPGYISLCGIHVCQTIYLNIHLLIYRMSHTRISQYDCLPQQTPQLSSLFLFMYIIVVLCNII